ncbi:sporulation membrane protein YtaF [Proteinivorax hydrogeniformans]|uniref:Sporulation membrane protein YtaF n=1 Tax=Proteinivorax hydrogeniformans TaxID=1826727 RepID=A0AAU8HRM8_9FIRM
MEVWAMLLIGMAVSIDGLGAGVAYGINRVRMSWLTIVLVSVASGFAIYASLLGGRLFSYFLTPTVAETIGAGILMLMGIFLFTNGIKTLLSKAKQNGIESKKWYQSILDILKQPMAADIDKSGTISHYEGVLLGVALAMDAFGAGFGAALSGASPEIMAATVVVFKGIMLTCGLYLGAIFSNLQWQGILILLPGIIFFTLGTINLL